MALWFAGASAGPTVAECRPRISRRASSPMCGRGSLVPSALSPSGRSATLESVAHGKHVFANRHASTETTTVYGPTGKRRVGESPVRTTTALPEPRTDSPATATQGSGAVFLRQASYGKRRVRVPADDAMHASSRATLLIENEQRRATTPKVEHHVTTPFARDDGLAAPSPRMMRARGAMNTTLAAHRNLITTPPPGTDAFALKRSRTPPATRKAASDVEGFAVLLPVVPGQRGNVQAMRLAGGEGYGRRATHGDDRLLEQRQNAAAKLERALTSRRAAEEHRREDEMSRRAVRHHEGKGRTLTSPAARQVPFATNLPTPTAGVGTAVHKRPTRAYTPPPRTVLWE